MLRAHSLRRVSIFLAALVAALASVQAAAQQDFSKVEIKATKLGDNTYMLTGSGGNMGLAIGDDAVFLIDDQFAPLTPKIEAAIKALTSQPVKFMINTHWHGDHTGGNVNLGKAGALIFAQDNVRKRLASEQFVDFLKSKVAPLAKDGLPVVSFSQDMTFHLNGDDIHAFHVPRAHTDGDAIIHFAKANVIHMGDTYFNGLYPFIDYSSGGTPDGVIAAVDRGLAIADDNSKIIPGHGPLSNKAELKAYREMLATVTGRVKAMLKDGKKVAEIVAAKPSAEFDERLGKGFVPPARFIEMIVSGLGGDR
jgi:glyoxylase-like metal-dependent hydrolase (beta-lactamase superfamily II)